MGLKIIAKCDNCGAESIDMDPKGWFLVICQPIHQRIAIHAYERDVYNTCYDLLCSQECVIKWTSLNLGRVSKPLATKPPANSNIQLFVPKQESLEDELPLSSEP